MKQTCTSCKQEVEAWNEKCGACGFTLELVPDDQKKARYLRTPALGALLFTQGWTLGSRMYFWFLLSLIPIVGIVALMISIFFGRRLSWKYGGWSDWNEFTKRMKYMDMLGIVWLVILGVVYLSARFL